MGSYRYLHSHAVPDPINRSQLVMDDKTYYCDACAKQFGWPLLNQPGSYGPCGTCARLAWCYKASKIPVVRPGSVQ